MAAEHAGKGANPSGFTLIEVIAALVLVAVLTAVAGMGIVMGTRGYVFTRDNADLTHKSQLAIVRLMRELHAMTSLVSETFSVTGTSQPYLVYDTIHGRRGIRKSSDGVRLYRLADADTTTTGSGDLLVDNVSADADGFDLEFFQVDPADPDEWVVWTAGTDDLDRLYRIDVKLTLYQPSDPNQESEFITKVYPRSIDRET